MKHLEVSIPGEPMGQARARTNPNGGRPYTPRNTRAWRNQAAWAFHSAWKSSPPLNVPVRVYVRAVATRPQRLMRKKDGPGRLWRPHKPDGDNCLKAVKDSLKDAKVLRDDAIVVLSTVESRYTALGEGPCVEVLLEDAGPA